MIDRNNPIFEVDIDPDNGKGPFVHPLSAVIDAHMGSSMKYFTPGSLRQDFRALGAVVTKQAIYSAMMTLARRERIFKDGRGVYRHLNTYPGRNVPEHALTRERTRNNVSH